MTRRIHCREQLPLDATLFLRGNQSGLGWAVEENFACKQNRVKALCIK
jgi:hypothetical protein